MLELRQVIGKRRTREGVEFIAHDLDYVIVDGKRIAVISRNEDMPLCLLRCYEERSAQNILDVVAETRKKQAAKNKAFWAPSGLIAMPPSREQRILSGFEEDEDTEETDDEQE